MSHVVTIEVSADQDGQRLDRWLKSNAPQIPYSLAQKLIRKGQLRVDGKRAKADARLQKGQMVRIPPVGEAHHKQNRKPKLSDADADFIQSLVIYDQGDVLALNKPAGLAVQGGTKTKRHIDGMLDALINKEGVRPRLVHRLDKDTSGVLLLARSAQMAKALGALFQKRNIRKVYWAVLAGLPDPQEGAVKAPLAKMGGPDKEKMGVDDKEGKYALTEYKVLEQAGKQAAFVAFWPRTGRTHQIRAHAALINCPVLGDRKYGGQDAVLEDVAHGKFLHLHAQRVIFKHPHNKHVVDIQAPLSGAQAKSWQVFGFETKRKDDPFADLA